jgi:hypothetical protein
MHVLNNFTVPYYVRQVHLILDAKKLDVLARGGHITCLSTLLKDACAKKALVLARAICLKDACASHPP